jgi:hypothetical protein
MQPSVVWGLFSAWRMWRLVIVVWLVVLALGVPVSLIVAGAAGTPLASLPPGDAVPRGEIALLVVDAVTPVLAPLWVVLATSVLAAWAFTVLWHAGVARFEVWGSGPPAPSHILGLGLTAWWRYCRLALTALLVLLGLFAALFSGVAFGVEEAYTSMAEGRMVLLIGLGLLAGALIKVVVWTALLRGAWELAVPTRRSAVGAWFRGLMGAFRQPLASFGTIVVLGTLAVGCAVVPLAAPLLWPVLRGAPAARALAAGGGLGAAFFSVALFTAFAPVSGLVVRVAAEDESEPADQGDSRAPRVDSPESEAVSSRS